MKKTGHQAYLLAFLFPSFVLLCLEVFGKFVLFVAIRIEEPHVFDKMALYPS